MPEVMSNLRVLCKNSFQICILYAKNHSKFILLYSKSFKIYSIIQQIISNVFYYTANYSKFILLKSKSFQIYSIIQQIIPNLYLLRRKSIPNLHPLCRQLFSISLCYVGNLNLVLRSD